MGSIRLIICLLLYGNYLITASGINIDKKIAPYHYTKCEINAYYGNFYEEFYSYVNDLDYYGYDDKICHVIQTGLWIYYENVDFNDHHAGLVYVVHGIDYDEIFPSAFCYKASSLKYAGNHYYWNEDSWTIYSGIYFTGNELYGYSDASYLDSMRYDGESIITSGYSSWTLDFDINGEAYLCCLNPNTIDRDAYGRGELVYGIYPELTGRFANSLVGIYKSCHVSTPECSRNNFKRTIDFQGYKRYDKGGSIVLHMNAAVPMES